MKGVDTIARIRRVVPADGLYKRRKDGNRKQPFLIHRRDKAPIAFAGL